MTELERHLRRAESSLFDAVGSLKAAESHAQDMDAEALKFTGDLVRRLSLRIALVRRRCDSAVIKGADDPSASRA